MAKSGAYISDVGLLEELNDCIVSTSEAMSRIDACVGNHLRETRDCLGRQLDFIHDRLSDARQRLSQAESSLRTCQSSPEATSCAMEEQEVEMARMEVEKWSSRYEQGQQILGECEMETGEYNGSGGGHALIQNMCSQQTPKASQLIQGFIESLRDILGYDVASANAQGTDSSSSETSPSPSDERLDDFRNEIMGNGGESSTSGETSRVPLCPDCGRPVPLCFCKNV